MNRRYPDDYDSNYDSITDLTFVTNQEENQENSYLCKYCSELDPDVKLIKKMMM